MRFAEYDRHIYVKEDEIWDLRGRFNAALDDVEPLNWVTQGNMPVLALAMDTSQDTAVETAPSVTGLAARLAIPAHYLTHISHPSLHVAYERYKACMEAQDRLDTMVSLGNWTGKVPIREDIINLFAKRSTWYNYYCKAFGNIADDYPDLFKFLERTDDAPSAQDLFGRKSTYTYTDIFDYRARCDDGWNRQKRKDDNRGEGSSKQVKKAKVESKGVTKKVESKRKSGSHRL